MFLKKRFSPADNTVHDIEHPIAIFGQFRAGTNYTRIIFERNYRCQLFTSLLGWKHGPCPARELRPAVHGQDIDILFVTKNPFSQIASLYQYLVTKKKILSRLLTGANSCATD